MEEYIEDLCLHLAASRIFSDALKTGDPEAAGKAYAEFFVRFKKAYSKRNKDMLAGDEDYRYEEILTASTQQPSVQTAPQAVPGHVGYDPEAARLLKEQQQKQQPPDSGSGGRSF